jgi:hypothetical protein
MIISIIIITLIYKSQYNTPENVINNFQKALQNSDTKTIMNSYCNNDSHVITNFPESQFEEQVWPLLNSSNSEPENIPVGNVISGLTQLKKYQDNIFNNYDLTDVTSKILYKNKGNNIANFTVYGTHKVYKKDNRGNPDKSKTINVQAQEIWNLEKINKKWCINSIAFIDKNRVVNN